MANKFVRAAVGTLSLSAVIGFGAYIGYEGYSSTATPPVKGDVPTYGFGTTRVVDGKPLKGGEVITAPAAVRLALRDVQQHETGLKRCMGDAKLAQHEFDALMSLALNVGSMRLQPPAKGASGRLRGDVQGHPRLRQILHCAKNP